MHNDTRGVAIIIVLVILGAIVAIGLGISTIVVRELQVSSRLDNSVSAIMAADAGMERRLYEIRKGGLPQGQYSSPEGPIELVNGATYEICPQGADCRNNNPVRIITEGTFGDTTRSLRVEF